MGDRENASDDPEDDVARFFAVLGKRIAEALQVQHALGHHPWAIRLFKDEAQVGSLLHLCSSVVELKTLELERSARLKKGQSTSGEEDCIIAVANDIIFGCISPVVKAVKAAAEHEFKAIEDAKASGSKRGRKDLYVAEKMIEMFPSFLPDGIASTIASDMTALRLGGDPKLLVKVPSKKRAQETQIRGIMHIEFRKIRWAKKYPEGNKDPQGCSTLTSHAPARGDGG